MPFYGGGLHEPGAGSLYGSFSGSTYGPTSGKRKREYKREGRGWNTNWMRYDFTREGRSSGYGPTKWTSAWLRERYRHALERMERVPYIGPTYKVGKKVNKQVDEWLDRELSHVPGYAGMSTKKRALLRNSLKGWAFERITGPQGLELFDFYPSGWPVGPSLPVPRFLSRGKWFTRKRRKYTKRRRYRR